MRLAWRPPAVLRRIRIEPIGEDWAWLHAVCAASISGYMAVSSVGVRRGRAVMVQLGFYGHMTLALGARNAALAPSRPLLFAVAFMLVFSAVIALFKDIPDVEGDRQARPACRLARAGGGEIQRGSAQL